MHQDWTFSLTLRQGISRRRALENIYHHFAVFFCKVDDRPIRAHLNTLRAKITFEAFLRPSMETATTTTRKMTKSKRTATTIIPLTSPHTFRTRSSPRYTESRVKLTTQQFPSSAWSTRVSRSSNARTRRWRAKRRRQLRRTRRQIFSTQQS